jgi:hypothetical protein
MKKGIIHSNEWRFVFFLFGFSVLFSLSSICLHVSNVIITSESIVLTFIGVLATFIVIGNYSQVTDIRNDTFTQIKNYKDEIQNKIDELEKLHVKVKDATEKINLIEKRTNFNSAEANRIYGNITTEKKMNRLAVSYYIDAVYFYYISDKDSTARIDRLLLVIIDLLRPENWAINEIDYEFNYEENLKTLEAFPESCTKKMDIIRLLKDRSSEVKKEKLPITPPKPQ